MVDKMIELDEEEFLTWLREQYHIDPKSDVSSAVEEWGAEIYDYDNFCLHAAAGDVYVIIGAHGFDDECTVPAWVAEVYLHEMTVANYLQERAGWE